MLGVESAQDNHHNHQNDKAQSSNVLHPRALVPWMCSTSLLPQFDGNYTLDNFLKTILWKNLMETILLKIFLEQMTWCLSYDNLFEANQFVILAHARIKRFS